MMMFIFTSSIDEVNIDVVNIDVVNIQLDDGDCNAFLLLPSIDEVNILLDGTGWFSKQYTSRLTIGGRIDKNP